MHQPPQKEKMKKFKPVFFFIIGFILLSCKAKTTTTEKTETTEIIYLDTIIPGAEIKTRLFIPNLDTTIFKEGLTIQLKTIGDSLDVKASKDPVKIQIKKTTKRKKTSSTKAPEAKNPKKHWAYLLGEFTILILSIFFFLSWLLRFLYDIWQNNQKTKQ